jgi:NAD(P)-dependent dehydrogenase (short-subunit alcohol dehydrogenase family)
MQAHEHSLDGKVAFVTGVGSGIGKATAEYLASAGARVAGLTSKLDESKATAQQIKSLGGEALALAGDVSKTEDLASAVRQIEQEWGRLDIVVANAGINGVWASLDELSEDNWQKTLDVNLKGTFLTVKHVLPLLKRQGGAVVIVSSVNGTRMFSNTGATAYACSKAGQVVFSRMAALELARHRVRVNTVCPGAIDTRIGENTEHRNLESIREPVEFPEGQIPLTDGESGSAKQVAQLIWFLASDLSNHITGTEVFIDGGQSLLQG